VNNTENEILNSKGESYNLKSSDDYLNIHIRSGKIVPVQPYDKHNSMTTTDLFSKAGITLLVYPDSNGLAEGSIYIDEDGSSFSDLINKNYHYYTFNYSA